LDKKEEVLLLLSFSFFANEKNANIRQYNHPIRLSLSARLISRSTVFFSHNKTATAGL
jgi:hypothetical protein